MAYTHLTVNDQLLLAEKLKREISSKYDVEDRLASEMAWDLLEMICVIDGNMDALNKYVLH
jgi:hypothetical protein